MVCRSTHFLSMFLYVRLSLEINWKLRKPKRPRPNGWSFIFLHSFCIALHSFSDQINKFEKSSSLQTIMQRAISAPSKWQLITECKWFRVVFSPIIALSFRLGRHEENQKILAQNFQPQSQYNTYPKRECITYASGCDIFASPRLQWRLSRISSLWNRW